MRYAKWRAADISKALREGRQPTPVSVGGEEELAELVPVPTSIPPAAVTDAPNTHVSNDPDEPYVTSALPLVSTAFDEEVTPSEIPPRSAPVPTNASDTQAQHPTLTGSSLLPSSPQSLASVLSPHQVDVKTSPEEPLPPTSLHGSPATDMGHEQGHTMSIDAMSLTPSSPPIQAQRPAPPTHFVPPPNASYLTGDPYPSAPPLPPPPSAPYVQIPPPPPSLPEMSPPPELTPGLIAKAQKHCRFAISALDYEDVEQARKELRAALAIVGG